MPDKSVTEAFEKLPEEEKKHGIRTAEYTQALFEGIYKEKAGYKEHSISPFLKKTNIKEAYTAGKYHELLPPVLREKDINGVIFTEEQQIGEFVKFSCEFDKTVMKLRSEKPFDDVYQAMLKDGKGRYGKVTLDIVKSTKSNLRKVFNSHIDESNVIKMPYVLLKKRASRPFGLLYRPVEKDGIILGYEAQIRFRDGKEYQLTLEDVRESVAPLAVELSIYFLCEACETMQLFKAYQKTCDHIWLETIPGFYRKKSNVAELVKILQETKTEKEKIRICVPIELVKKNTKLFAGVVDELKKQGFCMAVTGFLEELPEKQQLLALGISEALIVCDEAEREEYLKKAADYAQNGGPDAMVICKEPAPESIYLKNN